MLLKATGTATRHCKAIVQLKENVSQRFLSYCPHTKVVILSTFIYQEHLLMGVIYFLNIYLLFIQINGKTYKVFFQTCCPNLYEMLLGNM
jgi:hypothetical protein